MFTQTDNKIDQSVFASTQVIAQQEIKTNVPDTEIRKPVAGFDTFDGDDTDMSILNNMPGHPAAEWGGAKAIVAHNLTVARGSGMKTVDRGAFYVEAGFSCSAESDGRLAAGGTDALAKAAQNVTITRDFVAADGQPSIVKGKLKVVASICDMLNQLGILYLDARLVVRAELADAFLEVTWNRFSSSYSIEKKFRNQHGNVEHFIETDNFDPNDFTASTIAEIPELFFSMAAGETKQQAVYVGQSPGGPLSYKDVQRLFTLAGGQAATTSPPAHLRGTMDGTVTSEVTNLVPLV